MTGSLENLTVHPEGGPSFATGDLLSLVLSQIRLTGDHVRSLEVARSASLDLEAGAAHVLVVAEGSLHVDDGAERVVIDTGDLVLLPHGLTKHRKPPVVERRQPVKR